MQLIYDVGAHKGEDTDFYLKKGFKVVAVEANPALAQALRERFPAAVANGQLVVEQTAIAEEAGTVTFYVNERSVWGTIRPSWAARNEKMGAGNTTVTVPSTTFENLVRKHGTPHYVKIDIEGADMLCVQDLAKIDQRPAFVSIESNKTSWRDLVAEFDALERLGYTRFKVVNQAWVPAQREPQPAREGVHAAHEFAIGSTGLFGNDLPGQWVSRRRALLHYALIFLKYRWFGDNTFGQKIVRRVVPSRWRYFLIPDWYDTHAAM